MRFIPIFTYGTLMEGLSNFKMLEGLFIEKKEASIKGFLFDIGFFPGLVEGDDNIKGELFFIKEEFYYQTLIKLDFLESYIKNDRLNSLFIRTVKEVYLEDGSKIRAYVYIWNRDVNRYHQISNTTIVSYKDYLANKYKD